MDNRPRIERYTNIASFFLVISLVVTVILIILGAFDLTTQAQFTDTPGDPGSICRLFPARSIDVNTTISYTLSCPLSTVVLILAFLSIFLQIFPYFLIKCKRFVLGNVTWVLIRGLSIATLVKIGIELFGTDEYIESYCDRKPCTYKKKILLTLHFSHCY